MINENHLCFPVHLDKIMRFGIVKLIQVIQSIKLTTPFCVYFQTCIHYTIAPLVWATLADALLAVSEPVAIFMPVFRATARVAPTQY
jgi:putative component of membrane protein insertase Oxa1/YidC/SpoIIIJ protein YidD